MFNTNNKHHFLNNGDRKEFQTRKKLIFFQFCNLERAQRKTAFSKPAAQVFEAGDFLIKIFLMKKQVWHH